TTYSFALNLGCAFTRLPRRTPFRMRNGLPRPAEYECDLRRGLRKSIEQPELPRTDVWYIDDRGVYLMPCVIDAKHVLVDEGLPWFERFSDRSELLRTLVEDPEEMDGTWGFGNNPSPVRSYLIGYTALHLGKAQLALEHLERLV